MKSLDASGRGKYVTLVPFFLAFAFLYAFAYGNGELLNADSLFPEAFYRDIFLRSGQLSEWTFSVPSYWLDLGLFAALRWSGAGIHAAYAFYTAIQGVLLAAGLLYCIGLGAKNRHEAHAVAVYSTVAVVAITFCSGYAFRIPFMAAMHGMTLAITLFAYGAFYRALFRQSMFHSILLFITVVLGSFNDGIFTLWFTLPALAVSFLLLLRKKNDRALLVRILCLLVFAALIAKVADGAIKPDTTDYSPVHISWRKILKNTPVLFHNSLHFFYASAANIGISVLAFASLLLAIKKMPLQFTRIILFSSVCIVLGIVINGKHQFNYIHPVFLFPLLAGIALLPLITRHATAASSVIGILLLCTATVFSWHGIRSAYYPAEAKCLDEAAERYEIRHGAASYWYAHTASLFSKKNIPMAGIHYRTLLPNVDLTTRSILKDRNQVFFIPDDGDPSNEQLRSLLHINGEPTATYMCQGTAVRVSIYPGEGGRLASMRDYMDDQTFYSSTNTSRDFDIFTGTLSAGDLTIVKVDARYRMDNMLYRIVFADPPAKLRDRKITAIVEDSRAKRLRRYATKQLAENSSWLDPLWLKLAWSREVAFTFPTCYENEAGQAVLVFKASSRDIKNVSRFLLSIDSKRYTLK